MRGIVVVGVCVMVCAAAQARTPSFQGLGYLPGRSSWGSATGISADGSTVVGEIGSGELREAFRWTAADGMLGLGYLPGGSSVSYAYCVNADGTVIAGYSNNDSGKHEAFRWTADGGMVGLGDLPGGPVQSYASAVNAEGSVVVGYSFSGSYLEAFRWTAQDGMVGLRYLPGRWPSSSAWGVSADGSVVVGDSNNDFGGAEAFRWTSEGGMVGLGYLDPTRPYSGASAVNPDGSVVVGYSETASGDEAFRWTAEDGMVGLARLPGSRDTHVLALSADGSVILGEYQSFTGSSWRLDPFIWDADHGMRNLQSVLENDFNLDLSDWVLTKAFGISKDGSVIVGRGVNPSGQAEAWMAVIPEPASLALLAMGGLGLVIRRRGR